MLLGLITVLLLVDILVFHRKAHVVTIREAAIESAIWVTLGLAFTFVLWWMFERAAAVEYISGYLIEKSLSIDNVFVWAMIFTHFKVPRQYQHRVLFWGIFGALVMRFIFIFLGVAIIERFDYVLILFGLFLIWTGVGVLRHGGEDDTNPSDTRTMKLFHRFVPTTDQLDGQKLFTRINGKRFATPLLAAWYAFERLDAATRSFRQTIEALAMAPELGGYVPPGHAVRVAALAGAAAERMGLPPDDVRDLEMAALLHHLGQVTLDDPDHGAPGEVAAVTGTMMRAIRPLAAAGDIVAGDADEPRRRLAARILAVASAYDDLTGGDEALVDGAVGVLRGDARFAGDERVIAVCERVVRDGSAALAVASRP